MQGMNQCQRCGAPNQPGQPFCANCGAPLGAQCPACGAPLEAGSAFCGNCGAQLGTGGQQQAGGAQQQWGQPPQGMPQQPGWGQPPQGMPQQPGWGQPPQGMPQQPGWGQPPQGMPQQPGWGQPPQGPPQQPGWGQPPGGGGPYGPPQQGQQSPYGGHSPKKGGMSPWVVAFVGAIAVALIAVGVLYATGFIDLGKSKEPSGSQSSQSSNSGTSGSSSQTTTNPRISNVATTVNEDEVTIIWTTNKPCTSQVHYGETPEFGESTVEDTELVTNHSVTISGLISETTYYFKVESEDEVAYRVESPSNTFTTPAIVATTEGEVAIDTHYMDEQEYDGGGVLTTIGVDIKNTGTKNVYLPYVIVKVTYEVAADGTEKVEEQRFKDPMPIILKPGEIRTLDPPVSIAERIDSDYEIEVSIEATEEDLEDVEE